MIFRLFNDYDPHPGQARFRDSNVRFKNLLAGRRWGKDYAGAREFVRKMLLQDYPKVRHMRLPSDRYAKYSKPLLHYWAVAPDFNIGKVQQREIFSIFPAGFQADSRNFTYDDNKKELRLFGGRILVEFKSADRPESLVGVGLNGVYATEFARFKESAWNGNIRPTLTDKRGWGIFTSTPLPRQWYLDFVALGDPNSDRHNAQHANFFGKTIDNVRLPGIEEEIEIARNTLPERYFRREYEASLELFEGQVYEDWDLRVHCPTPFRHPRFDLVIAGVDWGFNEPGVILVVGVVRLREGYEYHVVHEEYERGVLVDADGGEDCWTKRALRLQSKYGVKLFYCDSEEPGNIRIFRNKGINAVKAYKPISDGIQAVAKALHVSGLTGRPRLFVDRDKCPNTVREVSQYQYEKDEVPFDRDNHTCDAVRYPIATFEKFQGAGSIESTASYEDERY